MALGITGDSHGEILACRGIAKRQTRGLAEGSVGAKFEVLTDIRIGISKAIDHPWRFLMQENPHVSVKYPAKRPSHEHSS